MNIRTGVSSKLQQIKKNFVILAVGTVTAGSLVVAPLVHADRYDEQINQLRQENSNSASDREELHVAAQDLKKTIDSLRAEIASIEGLIQENRAKDRELKDKIARAEAQLEKERQVLGQNIKQMYVNSDMSTFEMLAASQDLSEFIDREQYRTSVQSKITETMERIEKLKAELAEKKSQVEKLLKDQEIMRSSLDAKRAETNRLLSLNEQQQAEFNSSISSNNRRIAELQRQQALENARHNVGSVSYTGTGSYPWANVPFPNAISDPWGMYKRQCVSYTAWKVASTGRHMPYWGGRGNAKLWPDNARRAGIPVSTSPRVGDVAISTGGTYGHAMYVEQVHGDGTITISQYNASWDGRYSVVRRSTAGLQFIHF